MWYFPEKLEELFVLVPQEHLNINFLLNCLVFGLLVLNNLINFLLIPLTTLPHPLLLQLGANLQMLLQLTRNHIGSRLVRAWYPIRVVLVMGFAVVRARCHLELAVAAFFGQEVLAVFGGLGLHNNVDDGF